MRRNGVRVGRGQIQQSDISEFSKTAFDTQKTVPARQMIITLARLQDPADCYLERLPYPAQCYPLPNPALHRQWSENREVFCNVIVLGRQHDMVGVGGLVISILLVNFGDEPCIGREAHVEGQLDVGERVMACQSGFCPTALIAWFPESDNSLLSRAIDP